jgi:SAM-dependent methyltransferase
VSEAASTERLTDRSHWDLYWEGTALPREVQRGSGSAQVDAILDVLDEHAPPDGASVLEVGGAPGQYLAYLHSRRRYECALLDYSAEGCALARRNFELLAIEAEIHKRDLLDPELRIGRFDLVFSLGLVEHFADLTGVVAAHARLVEPGGTLIVGAPNVRGVNAWFMRRLCPRRLATHNADSLRLERWDEFERVLGLERRFRAHIGGFEPGVFAVREGRRAADAPLWATARLLRTIFARGGRRLRRYNHPLVSGYLIGVYRVS